MKTAWRKSEKLLALIYFGLVFVIGAGAYGYFLKQRRAYEKAAGEQLIAVADLKRSQIVRWLEERKSDASWILDSPPIRTAMLNHIANPAENDEGRQVTSMMTAWKQRNRYGRVVLLDPQMQVRLSVPPEQNWIIGLASNHIAAALLTNEIIVSDLHLGERSQLANMDIFVPLWAPQEGASENRKARGILMLEIDPYEFLFPHIQTWPAHSISAETLLVRREGNAVVFLNELRYRSGTALRFRLPISTDSPTPAVRAALEKRQ